QPERGSAGAGHPRAMLVSPPTTGERSGNPGASPDRSRRCKGSCFHADVPLAREGREGGEKGSPESEDLRPPTNTGPLAEGGFVFHRPLVLAALVAVLAVVCGAAGARTAAFPHRIVSLSPSSTESLF